jgi:TolB-like protein/Tfp pilus assembly protein PilF
MFTDIVGYSALTQSDESLALSVLERHRLLLRPYFSRYNGKEINIMGDSFLVEFESALDATNCAVKIQEDLHEYNLSSHEDWNIKLRIGMHLGDVVHRDNDILGDAVNIASRIQPLAEPEGVCISEQVYYQIRNKTDYVFQQLEHSELKNIRFSISVYKIVMPWQNRQLEKNSSVDRSSILDKRRIAILPFSNISPDPNDGYFADGMTEELITTMSKIGGLKVIARTSIMSYKGKDKKIDEIARELQVGTILEGSVRKAGDKLRITVQLIDSQSSDHLWSESYDREFKDVFAIQGDISKTVAEALKIRLLPAEVLRIRKEPTKNMEAYVLYLKGMQNFMSFTSAGHRKAIEFLEKAIQLDPNFALGYAVLGIVYSAGLYEVANYDEAVLKAKETVTKALEIDDDLAEAYVALSNIEWISRGLSREGWVAGLEELKKAAELNPNSAFVHAAYGASLIQDASFDSALPEFLKALELDPLSVVCNEWLGVYLYCKHENQRALEHFDRFLVLHREVAAYIGHLWKAKIYIQMLRLEDAIHELEKGMKLGDLEIEPLFKINLALVYAKQGRKNESRMIIEELKAIPIGNIHQSPPNSDNLASVYVALQEDEEVFRWLEISRERKDFSLVMLKIDPYFDEIRSDPRFILFLKKIGLEA